MAMRLSPGNEFARRYADSEPMGYQFNQMMIALPTMGGALIRGFKRSLYRPNHSTLLALG
jgi:hypothetical protein